LRVLYVQPCATYDGAARQASIAVARLGLSGMEVVPLVGPSQLLCRWLEGQDVRGTILSRDFPGVAAELDAPLSVPGRNRGCVRRISERVEALVRDGAIDLVLACGPFAWRAATAPARRLGVPVVWRADGLLSGRIAHAALWLWSRRHPPDLLVCGSPVVRDVLAPLVPAPSEVVSSGVDLDMFRVGRADPRPYRPPGASLVVGLVSRLGERRGVPDFIEMAARVASRHSEVAFLVAGDGRERARYEALARSYGLDRTVRFLGVVGDMPSFLAACDVVMVPAGGRSINVALEAMALERPLVAADNDGIAELVGHAALLYPAGDVAAAAETVARLVEAPALRDLLGHEGRARVCRSFDARVAVGRLAKALRRVAEQVVLRDASSNTAALLRTAYQ
jgi:glycosyltransferase involved in cell wall biosynthesis